METNKEMNVEQRINSLTPGAAWRPDLNRALIHFHHRRTQKAVRTRTAVWVSGALAASVCLVALLELRGVSAADRILKDRQLAPDFALPDTSGAIVRLSNYRHKVVLVNFWATWCGGCKMEIPCLMDFQNKYKDRGFTVIGVSMDDDGFKAVKPFFDQKTMNYPVVIGNAKLAKLYGVESMPETLLIDGAGRIAAFHLGVVEKSSLEREINTLLN